MGCVQSKRVEATAFADIYRPTPASFAVFDINSIEEPWLKFGSVQPAELDEPVKPKNHVPDPILQKLDKFDVECNAPHSWSEVSRALEDLKPTLDKKLTDQTPPPPAGPTPGKAKPAQTLSKPPSIKKDSSFHTLEELEATISHKTAGHLEPAAGQKAADVGPTVSNKLRENSFIVRDRLEREKEGKPWKFAGSRWDPLSGFPEKCPPGGADAVVLYTTTLHGVRRTFDDCQRARQLIEGHQVAVDERNVALHGEFLNELRELLGEGVTVPRLFVNGRYVGGVEEVSELNEAGRLRRVLEAAGRGKGEGRTGCEGCGGVRFLPCLECSGSCKVVGEDGKGWARCSKCNENGLVQCPFCV